MVAGPDFGLSLIIVCSNCVYGILGFSAIHLFSFLISGRGSELNINGSGT